MSLLGSFGDITMGIPVFENIESSVDNMSSNESIYVMAPHVSSSRFGQDALRDSSGGRPKKKSSFIIKYDKTSNQR